MGEVRRNDGPINTGGAGDIAKAGMFTKLREKMSGSTHVNKTDLQKVLEKDYGSKLGKLMASLAEGKATSKDIEKLEKFMQPTSRGYIKKQRSELENAFGGNEAVSKKIQDRKIELNFQSSLKNINSNKEQVDQFTMKVDFGNGNKAEWECKKSANTTVLTFTTLEAPDKSRYSAEGVEAQLQIKGNEVTLIDGFGTEEPEKTVYTPNPDPAVKNQRPLSELPNEYKIIISKFDDRL